MNNPYSQGFFDQINVNNPTEWAPLSFKETIYLNNPIGSIGQEYNWAFHLKIMGNNPTDFYHPHAINGFFAHFNKS